MFWKVSNLGHDSQPRVRQRLSPNMSPKPKWRPKTPYFSHGVSRPDICTHILPLFKDYCDVNQVIGAPKMNPEIGRVVFNLHNVQDKFIRFVCCYPNLEILNYLFRITSIGCSPSVNSLCKVCYNLVDDVECVTAEVKNNINKICDAKPIVPGLDPNAEVKKMVDKNLTLLSLSYPKTFQYGDTSIISTKTNDQDWAPGKCLNLNKYEGRFRVKKCSSTQQVI